MRPNDYRSIFCVSAGSFLTFCQLVVRQQDLQSSSVNNLCDRGTFCQLASSFCASVGHSVNFPLVHGTFRQLPSTFCASVGPPKTFHAAAGPSVNFSQLPVQPQDLLSTFCASKRPSVNFLCVHGIFHQLSVWPRDLPSTFCVARGPSINFSQLSMPSWGLRSTFRVAGALSVNIHCGQRTIRQLFLRPWDSPSTSVNVLCICGTLHQFCMRL